jgi:hypothetical protein
MDSAYLARHGHVALLRDVWSRLSVFRGLYSTLQKWTIEALCHGQEEVLRFCLDLKPLDVHHLLNNAYENGHLRMLEVAAEYGYERPEYIAILKWTRAMETGDVEFFKGLYEPIPPFANARRVRLPRENALEIAHILVSGPRFAMGERRYMFIAAARANDVSLMRVLNCQQPYILKDAMRAALAADSKDAVTELIDMGIVPADLLYLGAYDMACVLWEPEIIAKTLPLIVQMLPYGAEYVAECAECAAGHGSCDLLRLAIKLGAQNFHKCFTAALNAQQLDTLEVCVEHATSASISSSNLSGCRPEIVAVFLRTGPSVETTLQWATQLVRSDDADGLRLILHSWDRARVEWFIQAETDKAFCKARGKVLRLFKEFQPSISGAWFQSFLLTQANVDIVLLMLEWQMPIDWQHVLNLSSWTRDWKLFQLIHRHGGGKIVWPGHSEDWPDEHAGPQARDRLIVFAHCKGDAQFVQRVCDGV